MYNFSLYVVGLTIVMSFGRGAPARRLGRESLIGEERARSVLVDGREQTGGREHVAPVEGKPRAPAA